MENNKIQLHNGDCLEFMKTLEDNSVDLILTDPPYGTIKGLNLKHGNYKDGNQWDEIIDIKKMLLECQRILRPNGRLILFSQEPFTYDLMTNLKEVYDLEYNQKLIWLKNIHGNSLSAKKSRLNYFEDINLISKKRIITDFNCESALYAQRLKKDFKLSRTLWKKKYNNLKIAHFISKDKQFNICTEETYNILIRDFKIDELDYFISYEDLKKSDAKYNRVYNLEGLKSKKTVLEYKKPSKSLHPTQKPVDLLADLIRTYSNANDLVLDFTMGSGSTGIACLNTNRKFIGIELDDNYFKIASERINNCIKEL